MHARRGFTLIELLVVIAIVAVLAVTVVLTLNPAQMLRAARDSTRISDIATITKALAYYQYSSPSGSLGTSTVVYVSLPDSSASCANLNLPALPGGYSYACATTSTIQNANGTGWIPVNISGIGDGAPISVLPVDPVNELSGALYYAYTAANGTFTLSAPAESTKYETVAAGDGGSHSTRLERGSSMTLLSSVSFDVDEGGPPVTYPVVWTLTDGLTNGNTKNDTTGALYVNASYHWLTKAYSAQQPTGSKRRLSVMPVNNSGSQGLWGIDANTSEEIYTTMNFAWSRQSSGNWKIHELGVEKYDSGSTAVQEIAVEVLSNGVVRYYRNGSLVYTSTSTVSSAYYFVANSGYYIYDGTFTVGSGLYQTNTATSTIREN